MASAYDRIGRGYTLTRPPDPRIAAMITAALGDVRSIVNVGAGAGSYEPAQMAVVAVDPSIEMIRQRPIGSAPAVLARAESLPFRSRSVDAALALLTIHHWTSIAAGLAELRRVATRRVVIPYLRPGVRRALLARVALPSGDHRSRPKASSNPRPTRGMARRGRDPQGPDSARL